MLNLFARCTARTKEYDKIYASNAIQELNKQWKLMYQNLSVWTGQPNFKDFQDADYIFDAFFHQRMLIKNFNYPEWASEQVLKELKEMKLTKFRVMSMGKQMRRLNMGVFLNELKQRIGKALLPSPKRMQYEDTDDLGEVKKLYIWSTHDVFLFTLLADLNIPNNEIPPFGAAIIFELFTDVAAKRSFDQSLDTSYVRIFYLNETLPQSYLDFKANPLHLGAYSADRANYTVREFFSSFSDLPMTEAEARSGCEATIEENASGSYITVIVIESIVIVLFVGLSIKRCMSK